MSSLIRREPERGITSLARAMDRIFDESFVRPKGGLLREVAPAMDMYETDKELVVKMSVPGLKAEDIHVDVTGDLLTIRGEFKGEEDVSERNYHLREHRYGSFSRTVSLPIPINVDAAKAEFENGMLTLTAPKAEEAQRKTVEVKSK